MATPAVDATPANSKPVWTDVGKSYILDSVTVDFSVTGNNLAQNEIMDIYDIPANTVVEWAVLNITTAQADVTDVDLGVAATGVTAADLIDGGSLASAVGITGAAAQTPAVVVGSTAEVVTFTNKDAQTIASAVIQFIVKCTPIG
jgi:hypothetical protein